eukprot:CAMPEP_0181292532 /NCGR_PEP_ID=MMETSP1101-20121128/2556_1 /TAXON_ID=46948 /ORGANISM="Rhodomonas abbreviata, Strain Caron Lab Isolate" /LENGTH=201 /DNA_ID=CAMNT_0023397007 /DNA_START=112 /DNA_END=717 /DNA_ORIENTATION=-
MTGQTSLTHFPNRREQTAPTTSTSATAKQLQSGKSFSDWEMLLSVHDDAGTADPFHDSLQDRNTARRNSHDNTSQSQLRPAVISEGAIAFHGTVQEVIEIRSSSPGLRKNSFHFGGRTFFQSSYQEGGQPVEQMYAFPKRTCRSQYNRGIGKILDDEASGNQSVGSNRRGQDEALDVCPMRCAHNMSVCTELKLQAGASAA